MLWEFFWAAFEFLNAAHFNNSIIKTDGGPGELAGALGMMPKSIFAALLDCGEGDGESERKLQEEADGEVGTEFRGVTSE